MSDSDEELPKKSRANKTRNVKSRKTFLTVDDFRMGEKDLTAKNENPDLSKANSSENMFQFYKKGTRNLKGKIDNKTRYFEFEIQRVSDIPGS